MFPLLTLNDVTVDFPIPVNIYSRKVLLQLINKKVSIAFLPCYMQGAFRTLSNVKRQRFASLLFSDVSKGSEYASAMYFILGIDILGIGWA